MASQLPQKLTTKQRNDLVWDSIKAEIHQLLIVDGKTLPETIDVIKDRHSFSKSERNWKMKLQEWKFNKYIPAADMRFMVNKADKRLREEDKETLLYYQGLLIEQRRLDNFKKKKKKPNPDILVLDAATPADVTYHTPSSMDVDSVELEPGSQTLSTIVDENHGSDHDTSELMDCTVPSGNHQPAATDSSESSDPSYTDTSSALSSSVSSSTSNEDRDFPLLLALHTESAGRDGDMALLERCQRAIHTQVGSPNFERLVRLPVLKEDLRFLIEVIETLRNGRFAEDFPNLLLPSEIASINNRPPRLWDEFIELIELVLAQRVWDLHLPCLRFAELVLCSAVVFGLANCLTVSLICRYAEVLFIMDLHYLAEDLLRGFITELPNRCLTLRLHCRLSLAAILFVNQSTTEAVVTLTSVIRSGLHSLRQSYSPFYVYLTRSPRLPEIIGPDKSPRARSMLYSITKIKRVVLQYRSDRVSQDETWITALVECANIADTLSDLGEFSLADQLFSSIKTAIARFSTPLYGSHISFFFVTLGSHHRRQNKAQEFRNDIRNAYHFLSSEADLEHSGRAKLESFRLLLENLVNQLESGEWKEREIIADELRVILTYSEWETDQLKNIGRVFDRHSPIELNSDELEMDDLDDIVLEDDGTVTTQSTTDERKSVMGIPIRGGSSWETYEIPERKAIGQEDNMTICTSNKYGVTFSVSEMTGISYSEFMVP